MKPITVSVLALGVVVIGALAAILKYRSVAEVAPEDVSVFTKAARKDLYQDSFNEAVLMRPGQGLTNTLVKTDHNVIDGAVRAVGWTLNTISSAAKTIQNGYVRSYALIMVLGTLALVATVWLVTL